MKKVLILGERYFNFVDSTAYAFEQLGYDVRVYYIPLLHKTELGFIDHIMYKMKCKKFLNGFYQKARSEFLKLVDDFEPDMVFSISGNYYYEFVDENMINIFNSRGITKAVWYMDTIKTFEHIKQNVECFDRVFVFEPNDIPHIMEKYKVKADYLPVGVSEELYCQGKDDLKKLYDVSFVGNPSDKRLELLDKIAEYCVNNNKKMIVYGHYWHNKHWWQEKSAKKKFAKQHPYLVGFVHNGFMNGDEVAKLYQQSKICLNIHIALHKGVNSRTFEVMGNGNFELCDYREDAKDLGLISGENIVFYDSFDECVEKLDYYLNNSDAREKIAKSAADFVRNKYTITKLLKQVGL